jgi:hypothetical protein
MMTEDANAPAATPGEQAAMPETPALVEHVEAVAEAAAKVEGEALASAAETEIAKAETAIDAKKASLESEIEAWFIERIHNSPVSRVTEIYNHVRDAVDALKSRLAAL